MKIAVLVKDVPAGIDNKIDMSLGHIIRTTDREMNPYDAPAVEAALLLRASLGGIVHIFTMGPRAAEESLKLALSMGADEGFLISDPIFSGADTLITAKTIAAAIRLTGEYGLIICGTRTTDGDTSQTPPALATIMGLPFVGRVTSIVRFSGEELSFTHTVDCIEQQVVSTAPVVISADRISFPPRLPSLKEKLKRKPITVINFKSMTGFSQEEFGAAASPTKIKRVYYPERTAVTDILFPKCERAAEIILGAIEGEY